MTEVSTMYLTFADFQKSKVYSDNLAKSLPHEELGPDVVSGFVYFGMLWIEEAVTGSGRWYVRIANGEYQSEDLGELEAVLYAYGLREQLFEGHPLPPEKLTATQKGTPPKPQLPTDGG